MAVVMTNIWKSIRVRFYAYWFRKRVVRLAHHDPVANWAILRDVLLASRTVSYGRTGVEGSYSVQAEIMDALVQHTEMEPLLYDELQNKDPVLTAYCLVGLAMMDSDKLNTLPNTLFQRQETVELFNGPFKGKVALSRLAEWLTPEMRREIDERIERIKLRADCHG